MELIATIDRNTLLPECLVAESNEFAIYDVGSDTYALVHRHQGVEWQAISFSGDGLFPRRRTGPLCHSCTVSRCRIGRRAPRRSRTGSRRLPQGSRVTIRLSRLSEVGLINAEAQQWRYYLELTSHGVLLRDLKLNGTEIAPAVKSFRRRDLLVFGSQPAFQYVA